MFDLPRDLLIEILSRLPAKPLGKFKSVSKYWFSLISSADFVKFHHHRALSDTKTNHSRMYIASAHSFHSVDFESPSCYKGNDDDDTQAIVSLKDPLAKEAVVDKLSGSCFGLIFFVGNDECILLWNPTTDMTRLIPSPSTPSSDDPLIYGLGYDFSIDDYKIVRASRSFIDVFNLKSGLWRTGQVSPIDINNPVKNGIFSNGSLHWLYSDGDGLDKHEKILSFDMKDEIFKQICLPNEGKHVKSRFYSLGDMKGCLYAVCGADARDRADVEIWVMKEYGVENSWSKVITLDWFQFDCDVISPVYYFTHEDDVVIDLDSWNLVKYNLSDKTIKHIKKFSTAWHLWHLYTETLVSPFGLHPRI